MKKKISKKAIILIVVGVVAVVFIAMALTSAFAAQTTSVRKADLVDGLNLSGIVESSSSQNVVSTLSYQVKEIMVSEGDVVAEGDVLAVLDTEDLERDIANQRYAVQKARDSASVELQRARNNYNNARDNLTNGTNTELLTAQTALDSAQLSYDKAEKSLAAINVKVQQDLKTYESSLKAAELTYGDQTQQLQLEKLEKQLGDATITAPCGGTVTMVNATVGAVGSGMLFVIEDTENLIVRTYVKEFDIGSIQVDQEVVIKTDGTGEQELSGTVAKIAPTSQKDASGNPLQSSNVEFETEINILSSDPGLKIGMNARLNIIIQRRFDVFAVPFDAVVTLEDGREVVYAVEAGEEGKLFAREIEVQTGIETDTDVEIAAEGRTDGMEVVSNPSGLANGMELDLAAGARAAQMGSFFMGG